MKKKTPYDQLHEFSRTVATYGAVQSLLEWDQETYMPHDAIELRSSQISHLASTVHKMKTSPRFSRLLNNLIGDQSLSPAQAASVQMWQRDHLKAAKLPNSFIKTFSNTCSRAIHAWSSAKKESNFSKFLPHLEKIVSLCRKKADILGFSEHPYDALLDLYEPDMTVAKITPLFGRLKLALTTLVKEISAKPAPKADFLHGHFPPPKQLHFAKLLLEALGFDSGSSRLDISSHPFCVGLHPKDTRMTTRIHPENPMSNIFSVLHEGGHGLYNSNLPEGAYGSPLGEQISLGIDESQSRWWENWIGRSLPFWNHFYRLLQETFPEKLSRIPLEDFYSAINTVHPSLIRVEADEVTYSLHVILRFEIEKGLIEGSLKVKEVPEAWNEKMRDYLGISPPHDDVGCLQDIHWSMGSLGYFPTYVLGNFYAAQFFQTFEKKYPHWKDDVAKGHLSFIRDWLCQEIHRFGRQYLPDQIIQKVTGRPLSEEPFVAYLRHKYTSLYRLS